MGLRSRDSVVRDSPRCSVLYRMTDPRGSQPNGRRVSEPASRSLRPPGFTRTMGSPRKRSRGFADRHSPGLQIAREETTKRLTAHYGFRRLAGRPGGKAGSPVRLHRHRSLRDWKHSEPSSAALHWFTSWKRPDENKSTRSASALQTTSSTARYTREGMAIDPWLHLRMEQEINLSTMESLILAQDERWRRA